MLQGEFGVRLSLSRTYPTDLNKLQIESIQIKSNKANQMRANSNVYIVHCTLTKLNFARDFLSLEQQTVHVCSKFYDDTVECVRATMTMTSCNFHQVHFTHLTSSSKSIAQSIKLVNPC